MRRVEEPTAGRRTPPKLICSAGSDLQVVAPRRNTATRLAGRMAGAARRLAAVIGRWRERRRARRRLESWLTMDPRLLADRGGRWTSSAGEKVIDASGRAPQLRLVADDDLDAAA